VSLELDHTSIRFLYLSGDAAQVGLAASQVVTCPGDVLVQLRLFGGQCFELHAQANDLGMALAQPVLLGRLFQLDLGRAALVADRDRSIPELIECSSPCLLHFGDRCATLVQLALSLGQLCAGSFELDAQFLDAPLRVDNVALHCLVADNRLGGVTALLCLGSRATDGEDSGEQGGDEGSFEHGVAPLYDSRSVRVPAAAGVRAV
jgi:hypothetical protein